MRKTRILRNRIKDKFKKFSIFCKLAKVDRYTMEVEFLKRDEVEPGVYQKYEILLESTSEEGSVLTDSIVQQIKDKLEERGGLFKVSRESGISRDTISQVIGGKKYKVISPAVVRILNELGIKYEAA